MKSMAWWVKSEIMNREMEISAWLPAHPLPPEGGLCTPLEHFGLAEVARSFLTRGRTSAM